MNFLVILADDQRRDLIEYMPLTQKWLRSGGRDYVNARCNLSLCKPARAGMLTGLYSNKHNVYDHSPAQQTTWDNNWKDNTLGKWLDDVGYRTGLRGKYHLDASNQAKPLGWDDWKKINITTRDHLDFEVWDGTAATYPFQYQTEWLKNEALTFMAGTEPWFLWVAPTNPHWEFGARPADLRAYRRTRWSITEEADVSDKPAWIQAKAALTDTDKRAIRDEARGALRETAALDQMVNDLCAATDFSDTMVFYTADNAVFWGEHRLVGPSLKDGPYDACLRIPLLARQDGLGVGAERRPVTHQDITRTITLAAGATAGTSPQAGIDLRDLAKNPPVYNNRVLLHETGGEQQTSANESDAITTGPFHSDWPNRKLIRLPSKRVSPGGPYTYEAYDLDSDPNELTNWAGNTARLSERNALEALLTAALA